MRRVVDYHTDLVMGEIDDLPLIGLGNVVRIGKLNYRVIEISTNRPMTEIYVVVALRSGQIAVPDHILEIM